MNKYRVQLHSSGRRVISQALIVTLITLLCLPVASFASTSKAPSRAKSFAPLAGLIQVNVSNDADNLDPNTGCDTDAATSGEQCSLRAAIQRANALAGDDEITFNIPSTQPNCDPSVNRCTINLTKALPDLSTNIRIISPGIDKITVRRNSIGGDFRLFRVTSATEVTFSGLRLENGRPAGITAGGAIVNDGSGLVNVIDSILTDNVGGTIVGSGGALANENNGTLNIINCFLADNHATSSGGAISNGGSGTLNVIGSVVYHNDVTAPGDANSQGSGGGISNSNAGSVNISNSVISDNIVKGGDPSTSIIRGGGVMNLNNGTINVTGSVIHNNFTLGQGGGISNAAGSLNVSNSTIMQNRGNGGGVYGQGNFKSSIVAKNNIGPFAGSDVSGSFIRKATT